MNIKEAIAKQVLEQSKKLPMETKKQMLDKFREKNKDRPDVEYLVKDLAERIGYVAKED
jgi:mRNA-degrading endonuclease RelE of RelBE toxin-antitoxin system